MMVRRELGTGRWDRILMRKMTELSVADNYAEAKEEWLATGRVWWAGNSELPDWVANTNHTGKCLCGHNVVYHFEIVNTENGRTECVGSDHINSYLIMRQIAEDMNVEVDTITDEQVQEWIKVRVGSMKEEAWWDANGENFTLMFDKVKELDLWENTYTGERYYSGQHRTWLNRKTLRKKASGKFGDSQYRMGSIVWRWNHPDNPKAQVNTTGIPSDRLMQDLALLFVLSDAKIKAMKEEKDRLEYLKQETTEWLEAQRIKKARLEAEKLEAKRIADEKWEAERPAREARQAVIRENREKERREVKARLLEKNIAFLNQIPNEAFINKCGLYNVPVFNADFAVTNWEHKFLASIKRLLSENRGGVRLSSDQMTKLRELLNNSPTEKQIKYLKDLGYEGDIPTKYFASRKIEEMKENDER